MDNIKLGELLNEMDFCYCNIPEEGLKELKNILNLMPLYKDNNLKKLEKIIPNEGIKHLLLSYLSSYNLIEHGGTLRGSWLTDLGEETRDCLNSININKFFD